MLRFTSRILQIGVGVAPTGRMTLADAKERVAALRSRPDSNPVKLIECELALIHLLGQTGRQTDLTESLNVGDGLWARLDEEAQRGPEGRSPTKGLALHLCTSMRHAAKRLGDDNRAAMWVRRLGAMHDQLMSPFNAGPSASGDGSTEDGEQAKLGSKIRKFELDERGVRKNVKWSGPTGVHDTFTGTRHPLTDLPFMQGMQGYKPNPNAGSRY